MSRTIAGVCVRDKWPDYPKDLADWEFWQISENHEIGVRLALQEVGCMDSKFQLRRSCPAMDKAMKERGHSGLSTKNCSCYKNWLKVAKKKGVI
jgi:hypothetical protein